MSTSDPVRDGRSAGFTGSAAVAVRRAVTVTIFATAGLTFAFGFGNGWAVGSRLGVPGWIAPLVAPAVDLSVVGLLVAVHTLRMHGAVDRLVGPRLLLVFCGLVTLALNTAHPLLAGEYGRACFDAIAPVLLIGWSEVGPRLLAALHGTVRDEEEAVPGPSSAVLMEQAIVPDELVARAMELDARHRRTARRGITRDKLRAELKVSNAVAGDVLRLVRAAAAQQDTALTRRSSKESGRHDA